MTYDSSASFRMKKEHSERLRALSYKTKRSLSFFYNFLLDEYLDELEDIFIADQRLVDWRSGKTKASSWDEVKEKYGV